MARERIGGMQGIEAETHVPRVVMIGHRRDRTCRKLRQFLARNQITFDWMTPDAPDLATRWSAERPAENDFPVLKLSDGTLLSRPALRELAQRLGLPTSPRCADYDTVITTSGGTYEADFLVIALGADLDVAATPGLAEDGYEFYSVAGASRVPVFSKGPAIASGPAWPDLLCVRGEAGPRCLADVLYCDVIATGLSCRT